MKIKAKVKSYGVMGRLFQGGEILDVPNDTPISLDQFEVLEGKPTNIIDKKKKKEEAPKETSKK